MQSDNKDKKSWWGIYGRWILAFLVPFILAGIFGFWLGQGEFAENIGKNYSVFGKTPGPTDEIELCLFTFLILGFPAGLLGIGSFSIYIFISRFLKRESS